MKLIIENGQRFGNLTVIKESETLRLPSGQTNRTFECLCDCGNTTIIRLLHLVRGRIRSCGCISRIKNGESNTRIHKTWKAMIERVTLDNYINSNRYKARNIKVCDEWKDYFTFKEWALKNGYQDNLQIDRIDNNGNYEPNNCRFVTNIENANNREITFYVTYEGKKWPLLQLLRHLNIPQIHHSTIRARIKRGWNQELAIKKQIAHGNYRTKANNPQTNTEGTKSL